MFHLALAGAAQHEQRCNQPDDGQASNPADHAANNGPSVAAATATVVGGCADAILQHTVPFQHVACSNLAAGHAAIWQQGPALSCIQRGATS